MRKVYLIILGMLIFIPGATYGAVAGDFTVNSQSVYAIPPGTSQVLILDLTLPKIQGGSSNQLESIKINNSGTALHTDISKVAIWEDGSSAGWDGDESERARISSSPFWDTWISGDFSQSRIFVTVDIASDVASNRTIKPQLQINSVEFSSGSTGPIDKEITGFERMILAGISAPTVPVTPLARTPEALSSTVIRWHFTDLSNNEFGFKILDAELNEVVRKEEADLAYLDETGLRPDTEYSDRRVVAFNDQGERLSSNLAIFSAVYTLAEEIIEEEIIEEEVIEEEVVEKGAQEPEAVAEEAVEEEPSLLETIQTKIAEFQQQINELLEQLNELIQQQTATVWRAFQQFFQSFFGK